MPDELPEPPMIVLAKHAKTDKPCWYVMFHPDGVLNSTKLKNAWGWGYLPSELEVIPHPANSARAVEIIQQAKVRK